MSANQDRQEMSYIAGGDPPTPTWLTTVLREAGVLRAGSVTRVTQTMTDAFNSHTSRLSLEYSHDASSGAPAQLILKRNVPASWGVEAGLYEVDFYRRVASLTDHPPITVPCYAAAADPSTGDSYLLLQDVSATHAPPVTRDQQISIVEGVPPDRAIEAAVDTLASLHAYWWDHPLIAAKRWEVGYWTRDSERFGAYLARRTAALQDLLAAEGDWFPPELRTLYELTLARLPGYWQQHLEARFQPAHQLTLIHGDAYFANFLGPCSPEDGATYLLDWQSYSFDIGALDLVNLCATFWTSDQRHEDNREERILRRYLQGLQAGGVTGYTWEDLVRDYRHGLIFWLLMPVQDAAGGSRKGYWWPKMQCLITAYKEWHCDSLLDP